MMEMEMGREDAGAEVEAQAQASTHLDGSDTSAKMSPLPPAEQNGDNDNENDKDSDISMSSDSDSDSDSDESTDSEIADSAAQTELQPTSNGTENMQTGVEAASKKRKSPGGHSEKSGDEPSTSETHKKARLDNSSDEASVTSGAVRDKSLLAPEYLDPSSSSETVQPPSVTRGVLTALKPHSIWQASRRLFWPRMPAPLRSMSELSMWRLLCSTKCQECNKSPSNAAKLPADNLHNGPGLEGVTLIWPFGIRVCGPCLLKTTTKELNVLLDGSVPPTLLPALAFVYIVHTTKEDDTTEDSTKEVHVVSLSTIEQGQLPPNVQVSKLFLTSDVQEIKHEFMSVKALGLGTVEEWLKGLDPRGQEQLNEYRKWEKWAGTGSLEQVRRVTDPYASGNGATTELPTTASQTGHHQHPPPVRQQRTEEEVAALKAARRAELERRASQLDPPLTPNVLRHMVSFQTATQLITTLDDSAWDLLKPRFLAERTDAEKIERQVSAQIRNVMQGQDRPSHIQPTLATTKEAKDAVDKDWEDVQAPLRSRIVRYVDEFTRNKWDNGKKVKSDNCTRFAAEALIHIRKRFYAHVAKDAAAAVAAGRQPVVDPPEGPFTQKLTLENMRWIFDTKIKPITFPLRKEVFFCNGCATKPFGFEGVIQHYAAKHTDQLSLGNIVVHWRAEWPEVPPFNPEGRSKVVLSAPGQAPPPPASASLPPHPFNGYAPPSGLTMPGQPFPPGPGQAPAYGATPYGDQQYPYQYPGYPPNPGYGPSAPSPGAPPQPYGPSPGWAPYQNGPTPYPPNPTPPQLGGYQPPVAPPSVSVPVPPPSAVPGPYNYGPGGYLASAPPAAPGFPAAQVPYPVQLEDIVRNSRDIWNSFYNIQSLPGSVRIFVTIHHVVKRFRSKFSQTPPLSMFQDGLENNKDMRPVRNVNQLECKACRLGLGNAAYVQEDKTSFSLPQLVKHFQTQHIEPMQKVAPNTPPLDWSVDMIMLPPHHVLAQLPTTVRLEGFKYNLFSEALPEAFGQVPAAPVTPYYGQPPQQHPLQHPQQQVAYQPPPPYPPPAVSNHAQFPQEGLPQNQGQPVPSAQNAYQPPNDYVPAGNGYTPAPAPGPSPASAIPQEHPPANRPLGSVAEQDTARRDGNSSRSSQASGPLPHQVRKWNRKEKKKQAHASKRQHGAGAARGKDEEPKLPEEEKAREQEMRAMWANDRTATARVIGGPAIDGANDATAPKGRGQPRSTAKPVKEEPRDKGPEWNDRRPHEQQPSLLDALESHLDQGHRPPVTQSQPPAREGGSSYLPASQPRPAVASDPARRPEEYRPGPSTAQGNRPLSPLAPYYQRIREEAPQPQQRVPEHSQYDRPSYPQEPAASRQDPDERKYDPRDQPPPEPPYRDAPPPPPGRRPDAHQPYERAYRPEAEGFYERAPPPPERLPQAYDHYRPYYPGEALPPSPPRGAPTGQLWEITEYIAEDGSRVIERRPIDRVPPREPVYYDYPYEPERPRERPQPPIGTGRGAAPDPYAPRPALDDGYSRPYPPPPPRGEEDYARPPPQNYPAQPPPHGHYRGVDEYTQQPGPPAGARAWDNGYEPQQYQPQQYQQRPPPTERQQQQQQQQPAGPGPARNGGYEEEYDPRHPAAAAPPPPPPGPPAEAPKYQRRQVRYD